jgi:phenylacetate-CoA ligase
VAETLTESERYPWLTPASRRLLHWLHESSHAPRFNHHCGDRLTPAGLARVRAFERERAADPLGWAPGSLPPWLTAFVAECFREVPFYRALGAPPADFHALPPTTRAELSREPWAFVPDPLPLDDLIVYNTSGATGHPLDILSHPESSSKYLPLLRAALAAHNVALNGGVDPLTGDPRVALVLVCFQRRTYTYASVSAYLNGAGFAKINLNPADWRDPADRARYLDACHPEIYTGDPLSFAELARLPLTTRPKALISTAMTLLPGLRADLEFQFGCPVIDLYALNETGPIAASVPGASGVYQLLQHRLYLEIIDPEGLPVVPGVRGEVAVSGGFNPFLPLLRYRTGDWASLRFDGRQPVLVDLEGRAPVVFQSTSGQPVNNIDVTGALKRFALPQFTLHQSRDGSLTLTLPPGRASHTDLRAALAALFGPRHPLTILESATFAGASGKVLQYTRDDD